MNKLQQQIAKDYSAVREEQAAALCSGGICEAIRTAVALNETATVRDVIAALPDLNPTTTRIQFKNSRRISAEDDMLLAALNTANNTQLKAAPTAKQAEAIKYFRCYLQEQCDKSGVEALQITNWEVQDLNGKADIFSVTAQLECGISVSSNSLLRAVAHEWWHVFIRRGGKIEVVTAPKEYHQFNGKRAFGMTFKLSSAVKAAKAAAKAAKPTGRRSKYGELVERVRGDLGTVFVYRNDEGGYTVRIGGEPTTNSNTLEGALTIARNIAGPRKLSDMREPTPAPKCLG